MKRRAFKLLLFLLAGAIINVAVAWGLVLVTEQKLKDCDAWGAVYPVTYTNQQNWQFMLFRLDFVQVVWWNQLLRSPSGQGSTQMRPRWSSAPQVSHAAGDRFARYYFVEIGSGFPYLALVGRGVLPPQSLSPAESCTATGAILLEEFQFVDAPRMLPLLPIWPGFAINTIFYAVILWMLCAAPFAIRRRVRIKRGQCASCGYSLHGSRQSEKCPECGATA